MSPPAGDPKEMARSWDDLPFFSPVHPGMPTVDHGCIECTERTAIYRCIPCSDKEAMATAAVARGLALDEARRAVARRVHLVGELDARIVEDCVAAIDALRGAT